MKRLILFLHIFFLPAVCFAQERYHNSDWHFSLTVPIGWEKIAVESLSVEQRKTLETDFKSRTAIICQKVGAEYFSTPCILVQIKSTEEVSESQLEELFSQNKEMTLKVLWQNMERIQKGKGAKILRSWEAATQPASEAYYDEGKHASFEVARLSHDKLGRIVLVTVKLLGSHRMVSLQCFADGSAADNFLDLVNQVVDSFQYDEGYGFGESEGVAPGLIKKLLGGGIWSWILPILGISIVFWLLRRWVSS